MKNTQKNSSKNAEISTEKNISVALAQIRQRISDTEECFKRDPDSVQLLAVSKTKPVAAIQAAIDAGQVCFAENYLQEAVEKIKHFNNPQLVWHFIGSIQSNKTRDIAQHFQWAHTIDRIKIARRLNDQRPENLPPLNICLQINISGEDSKSGIAPDELIQLADDCASLSNIKIRGLMAMPAQDSDFERQRIPFRELKRLFTECQSRHTGLDTLSMGTTIDLEAAIAEGATMVRIGTAIFESRDY